MTKACVLGAAGLVLGESAVLTGATDAAEAATKKPGKVTGVKVSEVGTYSAKVSWNKVAKAKKYFIEFYRNGERVELCSTTKCSYRVNGAGFFALKPGSDYQVRVRAFDKNWTQGKWSKKVAFKTKRYKAVRYEFTGVHTEREKCLYRFKHAEFRDYYGAGQHGIVILYYTAMNNSYEDWSVHQPWHLYAYQNGLKLSEVDFFEDWGLGDPLSETIAPGYELDGYIAFSLKDNASPVIIHSEPIIRDDCVTYAFEKTLELV